MKFVKLNLLTLLMVTFVSFGMETEVTLSSSEILKDRFAQIGLDHFYEHSTVSTQLAGEEFTPLAAAAQLEMKIYDYKEFLYKDAKKGELSPWYAKGKSLLVVGLKEKMIHALLQDFPDALQELEDNEVYEPNEAKVILPSSKILKTRFTEIGLGHFYSHSTISTQLAGQEIIPLVAVAQLNMQVGDYDKYLSNGPAAQRTMLSLFIVQNKQKMIEVLLQDFPEDLQELKESGFY